MKHLIDIQNLTISFRRYEAGLRQTDLCVIRDLSVRVSPGEVVAIVGSSGSGKSLLAHGILGILPYNASIRGRIEFEGEPLTPQRTRQLRGREVVLVPQSVSFLDPLMTVGEQLCGGKKDDVTRWAVLATLARYGLDESIGQLYPFELSGGMARRVLIATAVLARPKLVIADEPTPGLHMDAAKRVMGHFREMADDGAGVLLITHDLELALQTADRVAVFYAGETVEEAPTADFAKSERLRHPYTRALMRALPSGAFEAAPGIQPYSVDLPAGCAYRPRCGQACTQCVQPVAYVPWHGGYVRCVRAQGGEG